ncbi:DUF5060 domain-containing protein [Rhodopirellula europaea]|uniref:DUF5060 domain-containing protein n=1 Tax=Rhodopirellula europaea TaxID=1263866 RepID=UPI001F217896|nr:DUF5060 domain-containing protein [Rhodopirellula europaea]
MQVCRLRKFLTRQTVFALAVTATWCVSATAQKPDAVFTEANGFVKVEAEDFASQTNTDKRAFYLTTAESAPSVQPDGDPSHASDASGGAYLEILPDTRRTHADKLIHGTNFSPQPGKMAVLTYRVNVQTPGRYYVWVRAYSTGSEDNGLHVGIDGTWPDSGQRLQWCQGKHSWYWDSKQRTEAQHCGEPGKIFLDIHEPGEHKIHFSMREDGFEFDQWLMTTDSNFQRPPAGKSNKPKENATAQVLSLPAKEFEFKSGGYYLDQGKWLAINPDKNQSAAAKKVFPFPSGRYDVTLKAVGENDGQSTYLVSADKESVGSFTCPMADQTFAEGKQFHRTFANVQITEGAELEVSSKIASADGAEYSRARWSELTFTPANESTAKAAANFAKEHNLVAAKAATESKSNDRAGSPTKPVSDQPLQMPREKDGDGSVQVTGEKRMWHKVTVTLNGPYAHEQDNTPNPYLDHRMEVEFKHESGKQYLVPGYFAADGNAANTSAESGTKWRANFAPDETGEWTYTVRFETGKNAAINRDASAEAVSPFNGKTGKFNVAKTNKSGRDFRAHGRLQYVNKSHLQFAGTGKYFLKAGADAPETLLGYAEFDGTVAGKPGKVPLKKYQPHLGDWRRSDPTWKDGQGKGLIGAVNYLSSKGCNAFSFLTYNAGGDGDNVWPFIHRDDKLHYDCSKLDQWGIVFDHGTQNGMYLHFKLQETENDDHRQGQKANGFKPESLDGGKLGSQRKLYLREIIARFGHNLALNWNLSEETTQTTDEHLAMLNYIEEMDPYGHNRVLHTFPGEQDKKYDPLLGDKSNLTGVSLQNSHIKDTHWQTVKWSEKAREAGKPWVVAFDESGSAAHGQCPDLGYRGYDGHDKTGKMTYTQHEVRKQTLWGNFMGGGGGVEYYFGYQYAENDLGCEDWRSRDQSWDACRVAIEFFQNNSIPFWEMVNADELVGNEKHDNSKYCLAKAGEEYVVYLPNGGTTSIDLSDANGEFQVHWYNARIGGDLQSGSVKTVSGGGSVEIGNPPADADQDWAVLLRK